MVGHLNHQALVVDENDLSLKKLEEYHFQLHELQKEKLQNSALQLIELWNLMDNLDEERYHFEHVTHNISATVDEGPIPGALALDLIEQAEVEVKRLDELKFSRMKEIAIKKQAELEVIYARAHTELDGEAAREKFFEHIKQVRKQMIHWKP